jgi:hypothetical protein
MKINVGYGKYKLTGLSYGNWWQRKVAKVD